MHIFLLLFIAYHVMRMVRYQRRPAPMRVRRNIPKAIAMLPPRLLSFMVLTFLIIVLGISLAHAHPENAGDRDGYRYNTQHAHGRFR